MNENCCIECGEPVNSLSIICAKCHVPDDRELDDFNEYNDPDATACAGGDYNTWEENELANDNELDDTQDDDGPIDFESD
jgi:hypothetical protein